MINLSDYTAGAGSAGGTLHYQDFTSSDTFTPSAELLAAGGVVFVQLIGGGGSGAAVRGINSGAVSSTGGDAGTFLEEFVTVSGATTVTIGAGGSAVTFTGTTNNSIAGNQGGNSSFGSLTATGGLGGTALTTSGGPRGLGGNGAGGIGYFSTDTASTLDARGGVGRYGKAGGGGGSATYPGIHMQAVDGGGSGNYSTLGNVAATNATANSGAGGGASTLVINTSVSYTVTSGEGGSGWCRVIWFE